MRTGSVLTLAAAIIGWGVCLAPASKQAPSNAQTSAPLTANAVQPPRAVAGAAALEPSRPDSDVVREDYPLSDPDLAALHRGDRIELPHPDGGTIDLWVARVESTADSRHLMLIHEGLPSTFTQSHGAFFGTLATSRGVYALEGNEWRSRLTRHTLLDQRMNSNALDYLSLPSG